MPVVVPVLIPPATPPPAPVDLAPVVVGIAEVRDEIAAVRIGMEASLTPPSAPLVPPTTPNVAPVSPSVVAGIPDVTLDRAIARLAPTFANVPDQDRTYRLQDAVEADVRKQLKPARELTQSEHNEIGKRCRVVADQYNR